MTNSTSKQSVEELQRLAALVWKLPAGRRGPLVQRMTAFEPESTPDEAFAAGSLRAAFAAYWEARFGSALPVRWLRALLAPPVPIGTVNEFVRLNLAQTQDEVAEMLGNLVTHLAERVARECGPRQRTLVAGGEPIPPSPLRSVGVTVARLDELVAAGRTFPTIYADPPWPYDNEACRGTAANHYPTMSLEAIRQEPVPLLAAPNAHLHLWTTNSFLRPAIELMDAWGFSFKSCLVWIKDELGLGNYWRVSHEFLLLGVRGRLTFRDRMLPSWVQAHRTAHSRKPRVIRTLIERVSPGPYLELYGREALPDSEWTVYGNQIEPRLF